MRQACQCPGVDHYSIPLYLRSENDDLPRLLMGDPPSVTQLYLGGAASVRTLAPLTALPQLQELCVESLRHVHDLSPLGALTELVDLEVGGDWMAPRIVHVDSLAFLREPPRLRRLILHTMVVDDGDYSPILGLTGPLEEVRIAKARMMRPTHDELCATVPALQCLRR